MPIDFWIVLWKCVLIGGVGLFAALAVVVTIGGACDIAKLLRQLKEPVRGQAMNACFRRLPCRMMVQPATLLHRLSANAKL